NDLQTPQAVALLWQIIKDEKLNPQEKLDLIFDFDQVFGLDLKNIKKEKIPDEVVQLAKKRQKYRQEKNFQKADDLRKEIEKLGFRIKDLPNNAFEIKKT
ncbi:MAG: CysS/YqeB C-terminal domain-containing protein, partial [Microgenomates group bacterium]